jgi:hypothetical protein
MGVFIFILYLISLLRFVVAGLTTHKDLVLIFGCFHTFRWWQQSSHVSLKQWVDKARVMGNHNGLWEIIMDYGKYGGYYVTRGALQ